MKRKIVLGAKNFVLKNLKWFLRHTYQFSVQTYSKAQLFAAIYRTNLQKQMDVK